MTPLEHHSVPLCITFLFFSRTSTLVLVTVRDLPRQSRLRCEFLYQKNQYLYPTGGVISRLLLTEI